MRIVCTSTSAAAQVLAILLRAGMLPLHEFQISPVLSILPPIVFTLDHRLPNSVLTQIRPLPDTTLENLAAA